MYTVGVDEAKIHFYGLLKRVAQGEWITITQNGQPVAVLQAPDLVPGKNVAEVIQALKDFPVSPPVEQEVVREMIEAGRD
ncbi:MAG: type II toxin-antitoxin system prevent-host-death family antitoxin [Magnetococcales bacterium]|nr:type II toxin-antitoxin system prevent-host-death family antitoxin [Magnetococcales bacterium]